MTEPQVTLYGDIYGDVISSQSNINITGKLVWGYPSTLGAAYAIPRVPETIAGGPIYVNPNLGETPQYVCVLDGRNGIVKFSYFNIENGQYVHKIRGWMTASVSNITNLQDFIDLVDAGTITVADIFNYNISNLSYDSGVYHVLAAINTEPISLDTYKDADFVGVLQEPSNVKFKKIKIK